MKSKIDKKVFAGQSLFEILIALTVVTVIIMGVVSLGTNSIRDATFSKNQALATGYTQEALDWLRFERDRSYDVFKNRASVSPLVTTWCISSTPPTWPGSSGTCGTTPITGTIFIREITLTRINSDKSIVAQVKVSWADAQGTHEVNASSELSDWRVI